MGPFLCYLAYEDKVRLAGSKEAAGAVGLYEDISLQQELLAASVRAAIGEAALGRGVGFLILDISTPSKYSFGTWYLEAPFLASSEQQI